MSSVAAARGSNAAFLHWRATLRPKGASARAVQPHAAAQAAALGPGLGGADGAPAPSPGTAGPRGAAFTVEALELLLFSPVGKLQASRAADGQSWAGQAPLGAHGTRVAHGIGAGVG